MPLMMEEEKGKKKKPEKKESKPHGPKPQASGAEGQDVTQLVRLAGVVVNGRLPLPKALMKIKGIGPRIAETFIIKAGFSNETQVGTLKEAEIADIEKKLEDLNTMLPAWMLNRRKDYVTGVDFHKVGPELEMTRREDINRDKKIRSYRGIRHSLDLPVRGQRTRSSFRTGTTLGVSRKKTASAQAQQAGKDDKGKGK
jgi:small subunit ribosomal protein S13